MSLGGYWNYPTFAMVNEATEKGTDPFPSLFS
jgi:hypothetical protein